MPGSVKQRGANLRKGALGEHTVSNITSSVSYLGLHNTLASFSECRDGTEKHSHQETGLATGTITNNNKLATNLSHLYQREQDEVSTVVWQ